MKQDTSMLQARESSGANQLCLQRTPLRHCITKLRRAGQCFARGVLIRRRERRFTVAEWQYRIERIDLNPETDPDDQLGKILREYGQQGWELVQGTARAGDARQPEVSPNIQNRKTLD